LVIFSPGFSANAVWYSTLLEQVASHGFIVLSPEHIEQDWSESAQATIDRPHDITQILDYAEALTKAEGALAGQIDMEHVAVVGHSFGGYTALASAGAQLDLATFNNRCAALAPDDPKSFLCMPMLGQEATIAARAGLASPPAALWPSLGDPRVTAIIPIAGDAYLFDQAGLANVTIPMMAIGGTADSGTPYDWGSKLSYDHVASEQKALVGFVGAEHMFMSTPCEDMPWTSNFPYAEMMCADPVWDKQRGLDLIHHFSTAFLLATLKDDQAAHHALLPDAVQFPGIEYSTTMQ
jgi:predicted dienelactone hydrolase